MPAIRSIAVTASRSARSRSSCRASVQRLSWRSEAVCRLVDALQHDDRDFTGRLLPVIVEARVDIGVLNVEPLVLVAVSDMRPRLEFFTPQLDGHLGVLDKVVVPARMSGRAALGSDDHVVIAIAGVDEWSLTHVPRLRACRREDQPVPPEEWSGGCLAGGQNNLDQGP